MLHAARHGTLTKRLHQEVAEGSEGWELDATQGVADYSVLGSQLAIITVPHDRAT